MIEEVDEDFAAGFTVVQEKESRPASVFTDGQQDEDCIARIGILRGPQGCDVRAKMPMKPKTKRVAG